MRLAGFSYPTHDTWPTVQQPSFNSAGENKALYVHIRSRTPLNYCIVAAVVVSTRIPMRLQRSDLTAAVGSPSMFDHLHDTLRCDWLVFLIGLTTLGPNSYSLTICIPFHRRKQKTSRVIKHQRNHRGKQRSGTKNGAIPEQARVVVRRRERDKGR